VTPTTPVTSSPVTTPATSSTPGTDWWTS
jgi:hypothetical protein